MHYAVWQRNVPAINLLIIRGADINAVDDCGYSALHLACEHGYIEIVKLLLKSGAKVDYRKDRNDDLYPRTTVCDEPLRLALRNKHYVKFFRKKNQLKIHLTDVKKFFILGYCTIIT